MILGSLGAQLGTVDAQLGALVLSAAPIIGEPEILALSGSYQTGINASGSYKTTCDFAGSYRTTLDVLGVWIEEQ